MNAFSQLFHGLRSALQWWVVLAPWEAAVRVRGGKRVKVLGAGVHFRIPFFDRFFVQSTRYRISDLQIQTLTTSDGETITLKGQVGYRISDIGRLYAAVHAAEATIGSVALSELSEYVATRKADECTPHQIEAVVTSYLSNRLREYGLDDCDLTITDYCRVRTYRLITQDIWNAHSPTLDTDEDHLQHLRRMG